jgi:hypothetical protein
MKDICSVELLAWTLYDCEPVWDTSIFLHTLILIFLEL